MLVPPPGRRGVPLTVLLASVHFPRSVRGDTLPGSVADMQDRNRIALDGESCTHEARGHRASAALQKGKRHCREQADNGPAQRQTMQSRPPGPETTGFRYRRAWWENSHSGVASASRSDSGVASRNAILSVHLSKELGCRACASGFHVFIALPDAIDCFPIIGAFPFEMRCQGLIQRVGKRSVRTAGHSRPIAPCVPFDGDYFHAPRVRGGRLCQARPRARALPI